MPQALEQRASHPQPSLRGWARAGFECSKKRHKLASALQWLSLAAVIVGIMASGPVAAYVAAALGLGCQVTVWLLQRAAKAMHEKASTAHRRAMLTDAFGVGFEQLDGADIIAGFPEGLADLATRLDDAGFFASTQHPGHERLAAHLQESAFWSKHLYNRAAQGAYISFAVKVSPVLVAVLVSLPSAGLDAGMQIARVIVVVIGALIAQNDLGKALQWSRAARAASDADRRLDAGGSSAEKMLAIFADYQVATALAQPIPTRLYEKNRQRLNDLWARARATASGSTR